MLQGDSGTDRQGNSSEVHMSQSRICVVELQDNRRVRVIESLLIGRVIGEPGEWRVGDACCLAVMADAEIDGEVSGQTCRVQVGTVRGIVREILDA